MFYAVFVLWLLLSGKAFGADAKMRDLPETTSPASTDILYIVVDPAGVPLDRKVTVGNLGTSVAPTVKDEGITQGKATTIDCVGGGVTCTVAAGTATITVPLGVSSFGDLSSGTNNSATMTVGSGASLTASGTGTVTANRTSCTGTDYLKADGTCAAPGGASTFDAITTGTNTTATMTVGNGASLTASGTGTVTSTNVVGSTTANLPTAAGAIRRVTDGGAAGAIVLGDGSNATCAEQKTLKIYIVTCPPWNIKFDNATDDAAAWATFIAAVPNYSTIILPRGATSVITAVIDISGKKGLRFIGTGRPTGAATGTGMPTIKYTGAAGGTMVLCSPCQDIIFDGVFFDANDLADFGFQALYNGSPTYHVEFKNVGIHRGATGARTNFIGIDWCGTGTTSNCEQLTVLDSNLVGPDMSATNSIGVRTGHSNSVQNKLEGNQISYWGKGVRIQGQTNVYRNQWQSNAVDISCQNSEPIEIAFNRTESGRQFFNGDCPVFMHNNRLGSLDVAPAASWIQNGSGASSSTTLFMNNVFSNDSLPPFGTSASRLISRNNWYSNSGAVQANNRITSMTSFGDGYSTEGDAYFGARVIDEIVGQGYQGKVSSANPSSGAVGLKGIAQYSSAASSGNTGIVGELNGSGSGAAVKGTTTGLGTTGGITEGIMVEADIASITNGTSVYSFYARQPTAVNSFTSAYGLYIGLHKVTGVTTGWGIYQAGATDKNYFAGTLQLANYTSNGFLKTGNSDGTLSVDTVSYIPTTGPIEFTNSFSIYKGTPAAVGATLGKFIIGNPNAYDTTAQEGVVVQQYTNATGGTTHAAMNVTMEAGPSANIFPYATSSVVRSKNANGDNVAYFGQAEGDAGGNLFGANFVVQDRIGAGTPAAATMVGLEIGNYKYHTNSASIGVDVVAGGSFISSRGLHLRGTGSGNWDVGVRSEVPAIHAEWIENDQAMPTGRWRWVTDGGSLRLDQNTHNVTEFATFRTPISVDTSGGLQLPNYTVGTLGTPTAGLLKFVTDADPNCITGGGTTVRLCRGNGNSWDTIGDGGGESTTLDQAFNAGKDITGANSQANALFVGRDSRQNGILGYDDGANGFRWECIVNGVANDCDHGVSLASGKVFRVVNSSAQTVFQVRESGPTVKAYWDAGAITPDGTNCTAPTEQAIGSGPKTWAFSCAQNAASIFYGKFRLPYAISTATFTLTVWHNTTETITFAGAFDAMCRADGVAVGSTWGTAQTANVAITTADQVKQATTAALTPNGTCSGGSMLMWRYVVNSGSFSPNAANTKVLGVSLDQAS